MYIRKPWNILEELRMSPLDNDKKSQPKEAAECQSAGSLQPIIFNSYKCVFLFHADVFFQPCTHVHAH